MWWRVCKLVSMRPTNALSDRRFDALVASGFCRLPDTYTDTMAGMINANEHQDNDARYGEL